MSGNVLKVDRVTKVFGTGPGTSSAVDNVSFELDGSEFFTLLGPAGCGKTTTLRMIAGLERATSGAITFNGTNLDHVPAVRRNIGMVFQSYALFPHMTVRENVSYGLRVRRAASENIRRKVDDMLSLLGLADLFIDTRTSGGSPTSSVLFPRRSDSWIRASRRPRRCADLRGRARCAR